MKFLINYNKGRKVYNSKKYFSQTQSTKKI